MASSSPIPAVDLADEVAKAGAEVQPAVVPQPTAKAEPQPEPLPDEEREEITLTIPSLPEDDGIGRAPVPTDEASQPVETARVSIGTPARTLGAGSSSRLPSSALCCRNRSS